MIRKLKNALYSLKQVSRAWYLKLCACLVSMGFHNSNHNSKSYSSFFLRPFTYSFLLVLVYIDDILLIGTDSSKVDEFILDLNVSFTLKDLGVCHYFLGIKVNYFDDYIHLSQQNYKNKNTLGICLMFLN